MFLLIVPVVEKIRVFTGCMRVSFIEGLMFVYLITNLVNGKYYVGKTSSKLVQRWSSHKHAAIKDRGVLYQAMREYGVENFDITVLSEVKDTITMNQLEVIWIIALRSYDPEVGYNNKMGGGGRKVSNWLDSYRGAYLRQRSERMKARWRNPEFRKRMTGEGNPNFGKGLLGADNPMYGKSRPDLAEWNRKRGSSV